MIRRLFGAAVAGTVGALLVGSVVALPAQASTFISNGVLASGQRIYSGDLFTSANAQHKLELTSQPSNALIITSNTCPTVNNLIPAQVGSTSTMSLTMQTDGNLVAVLGNRVIWNTGTWGNPGARLVLQDDMNLVVYSKTGRPLWYSGSVCSNAHTKHGNLGPSIPRMTPGQYMSSPNRRYKLIMQGDGNLVLYSPTRALWSSRTWDGGPNAMNVWPGGQVEVNDKFDIVKKWTSGTEQQVPLGGTADPVLFTVQDDGNVVLYRKKNNAYTPVWWTGTSGMN